MGISSSISMEYPKKLKIQDSDKTKINLNNIPDDQFLCPNCDEIPEILNIHTDNGHLELKCKNHGIIDITIQDYYEKINESNFTYIKTKCFNCGKFQNSKKDMFEYCFYCNADLCENCINKFNLEKIEHNSDHLLSCIPVTEKRCICLKHDNSRFTNYCLDCNENICEKEIKKNHFGHKLINFSIFSSDIIKYKKIINEKNQILSDIIKFNKIILNTYDKFQNNYFHIQSLINIGKLFEEENKRDMKELEFMIIRLQKACESQEEAIKSLQKEIERDFNKNEIKLSLKSNNLYGKEFNSLSRMQFKRFNEIDISENSIKNINPLNNMNLPHIEYIDLSNNKIHDLNPLKNLNLPHIEHMNLTENKIHDINSLSGLKSEKINNITNLKNNNIEDFNFSLNSRFPSIEKLKNENIKFNKDFQMFKTILRKYRMKENSIVKTPNEFNKKYESDINEETKGINLNNLNAGDYLLLELCFIINPYNNIILLNLQKNEIKDASIISRMPLNKLELLDLSFNKIVNVNFLNELEMFNLANIFLTDNEINDINPIINDDIIKDKIFPKNLPNLKGIYLINNNINTKDNKIRHFIKILTDSKIETDLEL